MRRPSLLSLAILTIGLLLPLLAWAQEPAVMPAPAAPPSWEYLLGLGPVGALVYGAWLLGRGLKISIEVKLADTDHQLVERGVVALEGINQRRDPA